MNTKRLITILLLLITLLLGTQSQLQAQSAAIQTLDIAFWPDYDRPALLVLMTGTLPAATPLPATLVIPWPDAADLNAVARVDENDMMFDDITYSTADGQLTLTTPERRFRIEYYLPYTAESNQRSFVFSWTSDVAVEQLQARIQQPLTAEGLISEPAAINVSTAPDGFTYHELPVQPVPAGQPYAINVQYTMNNPILSVEAISNASADLSTTNDSTGMSSTAEQIPEETDWLLIVGGILGLVLVVGLIGWLFLRGQTRSRKPGKPQPRRQGATRKSIPAAGKTAVRFCHNCGTPAEKGDKFCRSCGTPLKGKG